MESGFKHETTARFVACGLVVLFQVAQFGFFSLKNMDLELHSHQSWCVLIADALLNTTLCLDACILSVFSSQEGSLRWSRDWG